VAKWWHAFDRVLYWTLGWALGTALFLTWPLFAWAKSSSDGGGLTRQSWIAEHVWIGVLGALLVIAGVLALLWGWEFDSVTVGPLAAWPALTWAAGSDYTGYALGRAGWIGGAAWLGALAAWSVVMFVRWLRWRRDNGH
jgi:hypothetical protein